MKRPVGRVRRSPGQAQTASRLKRPALLLFLLVAIFAVTTSTGAAAAGPPTGLTAMPLSGQVQLAWQPASGATSYVVMRGTSASNITTVVNPGTTGTTYTDTGLTNNATYYYTVRSVSSGVQSANSNVLHAKPVSASCSSGNAVHRENCFAGSTAWHLGGGRTANNGGIEGYATATSIQKGGSIGFKIDTADNAPYHVEIWRSGYYGGTGARLYSVLDGLRGAAQPDCQTTSSTGLINCANWSVAATVTTTSSWPSGVYFARLVREDTGDDNEIIFVIRDDGSSSAILYGIDFATYQAYNNYGGKSLYDYNSSGATTVAGTARAVKVSYDRPFNQSLTGERDFYPWTDYPYVFWLERMGYDVSYTSNTDLETAGSQALGHKVYLSGAHDEYWSSNMRAAVTSARNAGVGLFVGGANAVYWKIRFETDPITGTANRVQVCYKSTQSGGADPTGTPTGTWRDPAGANQPENGLIGQMYVGDNDSVTFPLVVNAVQGADRIWRYSGLDQQSPGEDTSINGILGWEWDSRVSNGSEPSGVITLGSSPVSGELVQHNGRDYINGTAQSTVTKYTAPSGALVFSTGTNFWMRGLANDERGAGAVALEIQQATTNVLADMGAKPETPASNIVLDSTAGLPPAPTGVNAQIISGTNARIAWNAVSGASSYNVYRTLAPRSGGLPLGVKVNASAVTATNFTDSSLVAGTSYYYVVTANVSGKESLASSEVAVTPPTGTPQVASTVPASGATGVAINSSINATFSVRMNPSSISTSTFTVTAAGSSTPILAMVSYDDASMTATLTPALQLATSTVYTARLNSTIASITGETLGTTKTWTFTSAAPIPPPTVTAKAPAAGATGVSRDTAVTATFSRAMDATTITGSSVTLTTGSTQVSATVSYDATSRTVTLAPAVALSPGASYTAKIASSVSAADGTALAAAVTWSFTTTTSVCPCSLFPSTATPQQMNLPTRDGRGGTGPWTYELGVKFTVDQPMLFSAIEYYKSDQETGSHTGTLWSASGTKLASVVFQNETASGWQKQNLASPISLQPNTTYVVSVNANAMFSSTQSGLATQINNGPLHSVADGQNGVYGAAAGTFPTGSYSSSNYFVDPVVNADTSTAPPTVTNSTPADGSTGIAANTAVTATFSRTMDANALSGAFTLAAASGEGAGTTVPATVTFDPATGIGTLKPNARLANSTTYRASITTAAIATDGTPLATPKSWTFTTAAAASPPTVTATSPANNATGVSRDAAVTATFSRDMDGATVNTGTFTLTTGSTQVPATVTYDTASKTATLRPNSPLTVGATYTARLAATVSAADGTAMAGPVTWTFTATTSLCPCTLFPATTTPAQTNLPTRDGRGGTGPWTYELGVKISVDQPMVLSAIEYYRSDQETGSHTGTLWSASGTKLGTVNFTNETGSGWQKANLATPIALQANTTYVVSVNANSMFGVTQSGLANQVTNGPLHSVADGQNGVYGAAAGTFPTGSYSSSNYFVDVVVNPDPSTGAPTVTAVTPADGATGVAANTSVTATFSRNMNAASITTSTFTLSSPSGSVPGTVTYVGATNKATFTPNARLQDGVTYTARLTTGITAADGMPLAAAKTVVFTTATAVVPPTVTATAPTAGTTGVPRDVTVSATFSKDMDPSTITATTFTLVAPDGTVLPADVTYTSGNRTASLSTAAPLSTSTAYTARLTTGVKAADGTSLAAAVSWGFTSNASACPCSLFPSTVTPALTNLSTQDDRPGAGPWSYELGMNFKVDQAANLTAIRFYKATQETGIHTGTIWSSTGQALATVIFTNETASGWQKQKLSTPLALQANTTYVVSINANAFYSVTQDVFTVAIDNGPLHGLAGPGNGVFGASAGTFPTGSYRSSNYFVDVVVSDPS